MVTIDLLSSGFESNVVWYDENISVIFGATNNEHILLSRIIQHLVDQKTAFIVYDQELLDLTQHSDVDITHACKLLAHHCDAFHKQLVGWAQFDTNFVPDNDVCASIDFLRHVIDQMISETFRSMIHITLLALKNYTCGYFIIVRPESKIKKLMLQQIVGYLTKSFTHMKFVFVTDSTEIYVTSTCGDASEDYKKIVMRVPSLL